MTIGHQLPENHAKIDWANWSPPSGDDANHNILPHNGKGITKAKAVEALTSAFNMNPHVASGFASGGVGTNPDHKAHSFDLNHLHKHGAIEHDASLSREDTAFGDNGKFCQQIFDEVVREWEAGYSAQHPDSAKDSDIMVNWKSASRARYARLQSSKERHEKENKHFSYGLKEAFFSYGESALIINLLGKDGHASLKWIKIFFEEGRLPYAEGWRTPAEPITQSKLNHAFIEMIKANEHKHEEAVMIGIGTIEALIAMVHSLGAGLLKTPTRKD